MEENRVTLTFDDALLNTYEVAFPILEKYGVKAVCYVPTGLISGEWKPFRTDHAPHMSLEQIKELHVAGWEIGNHSVTHPLFDSISLERAELEIVYGDLCLCFHGFNPISFAFPYGHGHYTLDQVRRAFWFYPWVRTVNDSQITMSTFINGIPLDNYPPKEGLGWKVYVLHLVKDKADFERWISSLNPENVECFEAIKSARQRIN